MDIDT